MAEVGDALQAAAAAEGVKNYTGAYDTLKACVAGPGAGHPTALWRFAEACNNVIEDKPKETGAWRLGIINEGLASTEKCFEVEAENGACHRWRAVLGSKWGDMQSMGVKIKNSYKVREHAERAIAADPTDGVAHHLLGAFCYHVANISWVERKVAAALFKDPPQATFEEAAEHLKTAHELTPNFIRNALLLGDTHKALNDKPGMKRWYMACTRMKPTCALEKTQWYECEEKRRNCFPQNAQWG